MKIIIEQIKIFPNDDCNEPNVCKSTSNQVPCRASLKRNIGSIGRRKVTIPLIWVIFNILDFVRESQKR